MRLRILASSTNVLRWRNMPCFLIKYSVLACTSFSLIVLRRLKAVSTMHKSILQSVMTLRLNVEQTTIP